MPQNPSAFTDALTRGVLVFDGAMGTEIYRHHVFTNRSFDELCLADPKLIETIHRDYCDAGADVLTTNTFGAQRPGLEKYGLADKVRDINCAGARLARKVADAASRPVLVAGSIGPLATQSAAGEGGFEAEEVITEQVAALWEGGVDFIIFETQPSRLAIEQCAAAMKSHPDVPFILSCMIAGQGESIAGEPIEHLLAPLPDGMPQPIGWGMNCGVGPDGLLGAVERAVRVISQPLVVQPNAGIPREVDNRRIYFCSPEYLTEYAKRFVNLGASCVGGCCGTTPEHIREMARTIKPLSRRRTDPIVKAVAAVPLKEPAPLAEKSALGKMLSAGQWVTTVELVPPRGYDLSSTVNKSRTLRKRGVTAINIPDGPRHRAHLAADHGRADSPRGPDRADPAFLLPRPQPDRHAGRLAGLCGMPRAEHPLRDGRSAQAGRLSARHRSLRCRFDRHGGRAEAAQPGRRSGRAVDRSADFCGDRRGPRPYGAGPRREIDRFRQKIESGAEFAITQPVFDPDALLRMLDDVQHHGIPIVAGIWPLVSYRNALFMRNEVPGVVVPDAVMERMAALTTREDQLAAGIQIARESVARVRDRVAGIQVSAPMGNIETAWAVIEE